MFSLIVTLVALVLVGLLAAAAVYYGGSSFLGSATSAETSRILNESSQIRAAALTHKAQHNTYAPDVATLVSANYLTASPGSKTWDVYREAVAVSGLEQKVCEELNQKQGITGIPLCSAVGSAVETVCCEMP